MSHCISTTLENHFGADASLNPTDLQTIKNYLITHPSKNDNLADTKGVVTK